MSLPHSLLGLLTYEDSTGYDLSKLFNDSLNFFWNAQASQIYRELNRLQDNGLITSKNIIQEGRPNKRMYSITEEGKNELLKWLNNFEFIPENYHHSILVRIFFSEETDYDETLKILKQCHEKCMERLSVMSSITQERINLYAQSIPEGAQRQLFWQMTFDFGISQTQAMADWTLRCIEKFEKELEQ